jgi:hypothetical protein
VIGNHRWHEGLSQSRKISRTPRAANAEVWLAVPIRRRIPVSLQQQSTPIMRHNRLSIPAAVLLALTTAGSSAPMTHIGDHPVSSLTAYPNIHSLTAYHGRIYLGYGDYGDYPANIIISYSLAENMFRLEHSTGTDATDTFRVLDGKLFAPSVDPVNYEDFRDFSYYTPRVGWRDMAPAGNFHVYDAAQLGASLFICGSRDKA